MAEGYRWVKLLLSDEVHELARKNRGPLSWDEYASKLIREDAQRVAEEAEQQAERPPTMSETSSERLDKARALLRGRG